MRKGIILLLGFALAISACTPKADPLFGTWTVSKVNVQFDEQHNTPELVKQVGEMEKQNIITLDNDSILTFKGLDEAWQDRISLRSDGTMLCEGIAFGTWKNGEIVTRSNSPLGDVVITFRKK